MAADDRREVCDVELLDLCVDAFECAEDLRRLGDGAGGCSVDDVDGDDDAGQSSGTAVCGECARARENDDGPVGGQFSCRALLFRFSGTHLAELSG